MYPTPAFGAERCRPTLPQPAQSVPHGTPRDVGSRFGVKLRHMRKSRLLTQQQMAVRFGIDRSYISDVERGRKSISLHMLEVIALGMNMSLSDLFQDI